MIIMFKASPMYLQVCCFYHISTIEFLSFETNSFFSGPCCHGFPNPIFGQLTCSTSEVGNSQLIQHILLVKFWQFSHEIYPIFPDA